MKFKFIHKISVIQEKFLVFLICSEGRIQNVRGPDPARRLLVVHPCHVHQSHPGMLILVLVLKDSLTTFFKSLSLSWSLGVRSLSLSWPLGVRSLFWSLWVRSLSLSWSFWSSSCHCHCI